MRTLLLNALLVVASLGVCYASLEAAYRGYRYRALVRGDGSVGVWVVDGPLYEFDAATGFRYAPKLRLTLRMHGPDGVLRQQNSIVTNAQGHVSQSDAPPPSNDSVWTIVALGDSFTAGVTGNVPWPAALERLLRADTALLARVGRRSARVVNLGLDGTGILQWPPVYRERARRYAPDLVIVNLVEDDVRRLPIWRDMLPPPDGISGGGYEVMVVCTAPPVDWANDACVVGRLVAIDSSLTPDSATVQRIARELRVVQARRLHWLTPNPELLARAVGYRFGLRSRLQLPESVNRFLDDSAAVGASARALRSIIRQAPNVLVLQHPGWQELLAGEQPAIVDRLSRAAGTSIERMAPRMPAVDSSRRAAWFNLPHDGHYSDAGNAVYAASVLELLREWNGALGRDGSFSSSLDRR